MTETTIGIDIGGSSVKAVARGVSGEIVARHDSTAWHNGGDQVATAAVEAYHALDRSDAVGIGVGVPGQVEPATGQVSLAVNLGINSPYQLGDAIARGTGLPVTVENDVRAAALGAHESLVLAGNAPDSLAVVSIGTGISAGVVVKGSMLRGSRGMAGEVGHVVVDPAGPHCPCGQRGCLEAVAAGPAIGNAWTKGDPATPATSLFEAAESGDPAARKVADTITGHLATALTWLAAAYDTAVIMLAGGVSSAGEPFLSAIRDQIVRRAASSELAARRLQPHQVILADVIDPPGPRGAALLAAMEVPEERESPA